MEKKRISLPKSLVREVDIVLLDPLHQRPEHGAWSLLIEQLLREHLARLRKAGQKTLDSIGA
jgi:hypothetical protein